MAVWTDDLFDLSFSLGIASIAYEIENADVPCGWSRNLSSTRSWERTIA